MQVKFIQFHTTAGDEFFAYTNNDKCKFCIPYKEKIIEGKNGFFCITKEHEIIAFSNHNSNTESPRININFCPMCGRKLTENA